MVLADGLGCVSAFDRRDREHEEAAREWRRISREGEPVLAPALVLAETVTHLRRRGGWEAAVRVGETIVRSPAIEVLCPGRELLDAASREFRRSADPRLSLCDALSFVLMRERRVGEALTFDRHFVAADFRTLLG